MKNPILTLVACVSAGLFVAFIGHFLGQNAALAIIGSWSFVPFTQLT